MAQRYENKDNQGFDRGNEGPSVFSELESGTTDYGWRARHKPTPQFRCDRCHSFFNSIPDLQEHEENLHFSEMEPSPTEQ